MRRMRGAGYIKAQTIDKLDCIGTLWLASDEGTHLLAERIDLSTVTRGRSHLNRLAYGVQVDQSGVLRGDIHCSQIVRCNSSSASVATSRMTEQ